MKNEYNKISSYGRCSTIIPYYIFRAIVYSILDFLRLRADPSSIRGFDSLLLQSFVLWEMLRDFFDNNKRRWKESSHVIVEFSTFVLLQKLLKPLHRIFGISFQVVFVVNVEETKPWTISGSPFKIIQEWPSKKPLDIDTMVTAKVKLLEQNRLRKKFLLFEKGSENMNLESTNSLDRFQNIVENVFIILLSYGIIQGFL